MQEKIPELQTNRLNSRLSDQLHQKLASLVRSLVKHDIDLSYAKKQLESAYIREILDANQGNIGQTARVLGVHRNTLSKRIKELINVATLQGEIKFVEVPLELK